MLSGEFCGFDGCGVVMRRCSSVGMASSLLHETRRTGLIAMRICYFTNVYPSPSHTTMRREIHALERLGVEVIRIAARPFMGALVEPGDIEESPRTLYLTRSIGVAALCCLRVAITSPRRLASALRDAVRIGSQTGTGIWTHLMYIGEACVLLRASRECSHIHANFGNATSIATMCRVLGGPPVSLRIHGPEEFREFTSVEWNWKASHSDFIAPISEYGRTQLHAILPPHLHARVKVLRCGIEVALSQATDQGSAHLPTTYRLACVARLDPRKGHDTLLESVSLLRRAGLPVSLTLIGDGPLSIHLMQRVRELSLSDSVEFAGWQSGSGVAAHIRSARLLVLPSQAEGLPIVLMEAFALGRTVVTTRIMGIPELVVHGRTGWLVEPGDAPMLAHALEEALLAPDDQLVAMARAGRALVLERHDVNALMKGLLSHIADSRRGSAPNTSACVQ